MELLLNDGAMPNTCVSWRGRWLSSPLVGSPKIAAPVPHFRKLFALGAPVRSAVVHITALGLYECELNGERLGDTIFAPGWTDYRKRVSYQSYDVSAMLVTGNNGLGVILGDGWYTGHLGERDRQFYGDRPQFLLQLEATMADGSLQYVVSDASWKTTSGPILESDLLMGETYDARLELGAWSSSQYDDDSWQKAMHAPHPAIAIEPSPGCPVRRQEVLPARTLDSDRNQAEPLRFLIFDFGQNFAGRIRFSVRGPRGLRLTIRHAEALDASGALYIENLRGARATDCYILKGGEIETWEPRFTFHGFRYAEVSWGKSSVAPTIEKVAGIVLHSDMRATGTFLCSHELINQLERNILWGQKSNFLDIPTDCPQRDERLGWTGDAQVFIRTAAFHMDVRSFFHKWLRDMRDAQHPDGAIPAIVPNTSSFGLEPDGGPAWADATFICPWMIYRCYGDTQILNDHYPCMVRYMDYLAEHKVREYIRAHPDLDAWGGFGDWLALDGSGRLEGGTPKDLIGTAHYANDAHIMAQTAGLLGESEDANHYRELRGRIVGAFRNRYVTPDGLLASGTQTAYVLALQFDLLPPAARAVAAAELARDIERRGTHLATGFVGTPYLLHVLEAHGYLDVAYQLLEQTTFPSWLFPVKNGATTIWERWDGWTPENGFQDPKMNSFNHYAYGAVGDWLVSTVAGLEIAGAGYQEILFKPRPGGTITWAKAMLLTPQGEAGIHWERKDHTLRIELTVPPESSATLSLAAGWKIERGSPVFMPGTHQLIATT